MPINTGFAVKKAKNTNPIKGFPKILKLVINKAPAGITIPIPKAMSVNKGAVQVQIYKPKLNQIVPDTKTLTIFPL